LAEKLVRTTRRLADEINAEWFAVYVNLASRPELNPTNQERINRTLLLAEELGGRTRTLTGRSVAEAVLAYARKHNVTKVLVGKPLRPRWQEWLTGSIVDQLIRASEDIDIYVISTREEKHSPALPPEWQPHSSLTRYLISLALVAAVTGIGYLVRGTLESANLVMLYLMAIILSAALLGRGPALLATIASVLAFDFFLVQPYLTFAVTDSQYIITFVVLFIVSLVISTLTVQVREQAEAAIARENDTAALFELSSDLTAATDLKAVASVVLTHISQVFEREAVIFLPENSQLHPFDSTLGFEPDENELAVASWSFDHRQPAGHGTDTLQAASLRCLPLQTVRGIVGVLGVRPSHPNHLMPSEQRKVLSAFANQAALAIERASLAEQARHAELIQATEKLQTALLNSISHDLRTPLVSIIGALSRISDENLALDKKNHASLIDTARSEADRLNRLVGNLLNMTRLEAGAMHINPTPNDVQDVVGAALEQLADRLGSRSVKVEIPAGLPYIPLDFTLFVQVLVNLLDNAIKYSPPEEPIEIRVQPSGNALEIGVYDQGVGIPAEDLERVFDKFYRVQRPEQVTGTGLGLSICKGIVEAHGGRIWAENRKEGGTAIHIALPIS
jgi:two-component system sensor histidine kinase KdpD